MFNTKIANTIENTERCGGHQKENFSFTEIYNFCCNGHEAFKLEYVVKIISSLKSVSLFQRLEPLQFFNTNITFCSSSKLCLLFHSCIVMYHQVVNFYNIYLKYI